MPYDSQNKVGVVVFCCEGALQRHFVQLVNERFDLLGVVWYQPTNNKQNWFTRTKYLLGYLNLGKAIRYIKSRLYLPSYEARAESGFTAEFGHLKEMLPHRVNSIEVSDINDTKVANFVNGLKPDIVCVNGTNLVRQPLLGQIGNLPLGAINLHTGLSPYARGGNCNLYVLLEGKPELMGGTIHILDAGIDSGDIIHTFQAEFNESDPFELIENRVFMQGFAAMITCVEKLANASISTVKQWQKGNLYLKKTGYQYEPYQRLLANQRIDQGVLAGYLKNKSSRDAAVRLVEM